MTTQAATEADKSTVITAYKGFDANMRCRGFQFEVGKTYIHEGPVELCASGFHACEEPLDCIKHYSIADGRFAEVELAGVSDEREGDTKRVGSRITIKSTLSVAELVEAQVDWYRRHPDKGRSGDGSRSSSSGDYSISVSIGRYSTSASSGHGSKSVSSGNRSASGSSGSGSISASSGDYSTSVSSGEVSASVSSGDYSKSASSGNSSISVSSGRYSTSVSSGPSSKSVSIGRYSTSASSGDYARSACDTNGFASVAGHNGAVKGGTGSALSLGYIDADGERNFAVAKVGKNGIKPDTWYRVDASGAFVEVSP